MSKFKCLRILFHLDEPHETLLENNRPPLPLILLSVDSAVPLETAKNLLAFISHTPHSDTVDLRQTYQTR